LLKILNILHIMKLSKHPFRLLILFVGFSCKQPKELVDLKTVLSGNNSLLVSGLQCACVNKQIEALYKSNPSIYKDYEIYGDTTYLRGLSFKRIVIHLPQSTLDSLYPENSDLMIINKTKYPRQIIKLNFEAIKKLKEML
jgi:hypothetical protein